MTSTKTTKENNIFKKFYNIESGENFLNDLKLIFTPPKFFNDFNELIPGYSPTELTNKIAIEIIDNDDFLTNMYHLYKDAVFLPETSDKFELRKFLTCEENIWLLKSMINNGYSKLIKTYKAITSEQIGICCFTDDHLNELMWAHYAESSKGFCITFNFNSYEFPVIDKGYINYTNIRPQIAPDFIINDRNEFYHAMCFTKSPCWNYENEYRLIMDLEDCQYFYKGKDKYYYKQINSEIIDTIYIGPDSPYVNKHAYIKSIIGEKAKIINVVPNLKEFNYIEQRVLRGPVVYNKP